MPLCELGPSCPVPDPRGMAGAIFVPLSTHRLPTQLRKPQKCDGHHSYWLRPDLVLKHEGGDENPEANRGLPWRIPVRYPAFQPERLARLGLQHFSPALLQSSRLLPGTLSP